MYCRNCGTEHPDTAQFCPNCGVGTAPGGVAVSTEYAGFWRRIAAYLVVALILAIPNIILSRIGGAGSLAVIVVDWIYFAYQESSPAQATLGSGCSASRLRTPRATRSASAGPRAVTSRRSCQSSPC